MIVSEKMLEYYKNAPPFSFSPGVKPEDVRPHKPEDCKRFPSCCAWEFAARHYDDCIKNGMPTLWSPYFPHKEGTDTPEEYMRKIKISTAMFFGPAGNA